MTHESCFDQEFYDPFATQFFFVFSLRRRHSTVKHFAGCHRGKKNKNGNKMTSLISSQTSIIQDNNKDEASKAAALELWDMIHASEKTQNGASQFRFTKAQRDRTLIHPALRQPTPREEARRRKFTPQVKNPVEMHCAPCRSIDEPGKNLSKNEINSNTTWDLDDMHRRLSKALARANLTEGGNMKHDGFDVTPTSTLNFPDPHYNPTRWNTEESLNSAPLREEIDQLEDRTVPGAEASVSPSEIEMNKPQHTFVVCADSQIGMASQNKEWNTELEYCRQAIAKINALEPKPSFVCVCGDLVDMEWTFFANAKTGLTKEECDAIQDQQNRDLQETWSLLDENIPLVCLCGNHDVGNRPTKVSIEKFKNAFGDDYLAFWSNGSYNIVLNNVLFSNPDGAKDLYEEQLAWLESRLSYARNHDTNHIFVFGHHPWFLYSEDEEPGDLRGGSAFPPEWGKSDQVFPDSYFSVQKRYRQVAMRLFKKYGVSACFSGHFHQNLVSKSSFGMYMIITAPLSMVFESTGKPKEQSELELNGRGVRMVEVFKGGFTHRFELC